MDRSQLYLSDKNSCSVSRQNETQLAGTPSFGYGTASTPGLDAQTPSIADPYLPTPAGTGATPAMASIPAYTNSSGSLRVSSTRNARLIDGLIYT